MPMHLSATQKLQYRLRQERDSGQTSALPPRERWQGGVMLWSEIVYCAPTVTAEWRERAERVHLLDELAPSIGLAIAPEFEGQGTRLALDIDTLGYGGLVRFEDLTTLDNYLRVLVGDGLYPLVVSEDGLLDFWKQLTMQCDRHFLLIADRHRCYGYWESALAFNPSPQE